MASTYRHLRLALGLSPLCRSDTDTAPATYTYRDTDTCVSLFMVRPEMQLKVVTTNWSRPEMGFGSRLGSA